jgi:hypothetical protein
MIATAYSANSFTVLGPFLRGEVPESARRLADAMGWSSLVVAALVALWLIHRYRWLLTRSSVEAR